MEGGDNVPLLNNVTLSDEDHAERFNLTAAHVSLHVNSHCSAKCLWEAAPSCLCLMSWLCALLAVLVADMYEVTRILAEVMAFFGLSSSEERCSHLYVSFKSGRILYFRCGTLEKIRPLTYHIY